MNKWIRWSLIGIGALIALIVLVGAIGHVMAERQLNRRVALPPMRPVAAPGDAAALERGRYLFASRGCIECHGANGAGRVFVDDGKGLKFAGPNISPGPGSVVTGYAGEDWDRIVRHGVKRDGRPALIMPSEDYNRFTDADFGALVAYVRSLPPVAGSGAVLDLPLPVRVLYGFGAIKDAAAKIDHSLPAAQPVAESVTLEHGRYVANACLGCHGPLLQGGPVPGGPPDWPPAARLASGPGSVMPRYPDADSLIALFRSGKRADGQVVKVMPFESLSQINETDLRALHLYLKSL